MSLTVQEPRQGLATGTGSTLTVAEEEFAGIAGEITAVAVAVFVMAPGAVGVTTISTSAVFPLLTTPKAHWTMSRPLTLSL